MQCSLYHFQGLSSNSATRRYRYAHALHSSDFINTSVCWPLASRSNAMACALQRTATAVATLHVGLPSGRPTAMATLLSCDQHAVMRSVHRSTPCQYRHKPRNTLMHGRMPHIVNTSLALHPCYGMSDPPQWKAHAPHHHINVLMLQAFKPSWLMNAIGAVPRPDTQLPQIVILWGHVRLHEVCSNARTAFTSHCTEGKGSLIRPSCPHAHYAALGLPAPVCVTAGVLLRQIHIVRALA